MKKFCLAFFGILLYISGSSQVISNLVLVGDKGVTEDIREAKYFIVVKDYPNSIFERLEYKFGGPLQKLKTYKDSLLQMPDGRYIEYAANGTMYLKGMYTSGLKDKDWSYYNDTGKVLLVQKYQEGKLIGAENPDTVPSKPRSDNVDGGEIDAAFGGGDRAWSQYIMKNLNADVTEKSHKGGKVIVNFSIDTTGKMDNIFLGKSAEFVLDEEALRVVSRSPDAWKPAVQDGKHVRAYRRQPITFFYEEN